VLFLRYASLAKFKKILVPLDGSKKSFTALDNAICIANLSGAQVTGIHILPKIVIAGTRTSSIEHQIAAEGKSILKSGKEKSNKSNVAYESELISGEPGPSITKYAKSGKFDLIVMSSTGTGSVKDGFFGSISNYVMHSSEIPIMIIR
jgi:nucleotide-binding universal stress UspA family protein